MKKTATALLILAAFSYIYCNQTIKCMPNIQNRYGNLTVVDYFKKTRNTRGYRIMLNCICDCGNKTTVDLEKAKAGIIKGCGCMRKLSRLTHGLSKQRTYKIYTGILYRCYNSKSTNPRHKDYAGRGIGVCDEWRNSFLSFHKWCMENGYEKEKSIDRINNDLGYSPENCRFVNQVMQMSNTRLTRHITVDGVTKTMSAWARFYGINVSSLSERIDKLNGRDVAYAMYTRKT